MSAESGSLRPCPLGTARGTVGPDPLGASLLLLPSCCQAQTPSWTPRNCLFTQSLCLLRILLELFREGVLHMSRCCYMVQFVA